MLKGFEYQVEVFQIYFVLLKSRGWNEIELII